jgi:hypothetical protein
MMRKVDAEGGAGRGGVAAGEDSASRTRRRRRDLAGDVPALEERARAGLPLKD